MSVDSSPIITEMPMFKASLAYSLRIESYTAIPSLRYSGIHFSNLFLALIFIPNIHYNQIQVNSPEQCMKIG